MALDDLNALGYRGEDLVREVPAPAYAVRGVEFFARAVRGPEPLETFGYAYAVERSSLSVTRDDLRTYEAFLPEGVNALTCRWHHSGVGGDVAHVKFFIHAASRLPAADRARIARAVYDAQRFLISLPQMWTSEVKRLEKLFSRHHEPVAANCGRTISA